MRRQSARCYVKDRRRQFAGNLVHVWNHQQQALRRRKGRRQRTGLQRAMDSASGTTFGLQFDNARDAAPYIRLALRCPFIGQLAHAGRWCDRVNGDHFRNAVSHVGDGFVTVNSQHLFHVQSCPENVCRPWRYTPLSIFAAAQQLDSTPTKRAFKRSSTEIKTKKHDKCRGYRSLMMKL